MRLQKTISTLLVCTMIFSIFTVVISTLTVNTMDQQLPMDNIQALKTDENLFSTVTQPISLTTCAQLDEDSTDTIAPSQPIYNATSNNEMKNIKEFSPLEHTRMSEYESHLLTEKEVEELKKEIGVKDPNKNYNVIFNGLGTGLAPPTENEWNSMVGKIEVVDSALNADLPGYVNHSTSTYFPPVRSQASQGSCAA